MVQQWRSTTNGVSRGLVVAIGLVVLALGTWTIVGGAPYQGAEEQNVRAVVGVVEQFMAAGAQDDPSVGYQLVSAVSPALSADGIAMLFQTKRDLFDGYTAIGQNPYGISLRTSWNGTRAMLNGVASYNGRSDVPVRAELIKFNNQWRLTTINFGAEATQPTP